MLNKNEQMELITKENKKQFTEWAERTSRFQHFETFINLDFEMQTGVLLAYYDSLNEQIHIEYKYIDRQWESSVGGWFRDGFRKRNEAHSAAFLRADDIINQRMA